MILGAADIELMNQILVQLDWLTVKEPITVKTDRAGTVVTGQIAVPVPGSRGELEILVWVLENFPLGEIRFIGQNFQGYPHQMASPIGWICLNAELSPEVGPRFELELDKLQAWIQKYYINKEQDDHYEYPTVKDQQPLWVVFEEDDKTFTRTDDCGWFEYRGLRNGNQDGKPADTWIVTKLGRSKSRWSETFVNSLEYEQDGLYVLLGRPPLGVGRQVVETWAQLLPLMTESQRRFIHDNRLKVRPNIAINRAFLLLVGYPIGGGGRAEFHWLPVYVSIDDFPYKGLKTGAGQWSFQDLGKQIVWGTSENASYKRLFGRGQLTDKLTNKKILILGTGAIGSTLFMSLVRGGCRNIDLQDGDFVMPGNVTRGHFEFKSTAFSKVEELVTEAVRISPYLDITGTPKRLIPLNPGSPKFQEERHRLNRYDFIFDCTTDKLLSISLDKMQLYASIHNISLTNGATHLAWITGYGNIHLVKSAFYARLEQLEQKSLFLAQGCWYPTFNATNVDVQILVNLALQEFLRMTVEDDNVGSFYVERVSRPGETVAYQIKKDV
jgi:hypothetical protein